MNLSILIWLPLAAVVAGLVLPAPRRASRRCWARGRRSCSPWSCSFRLRRRPAGAAVRHRQDVDQPARHPLQARRRRPEPLPHRAGGAAVLRQRGVGGAARVGAPAPVLPVVRPGRERRAGRAHGPGPRALRDLLRRHARAVPVPGRRLGRRAQPRGEHDQALHLHARRLAADALGGDRHRRARRRATPSPSTSSSSARTRAGCRPGRRTGSSCSSPRPSWSRCRPSRCTAGCPTGTRRCRCRCWRSSRAILSKVAAYGFLRVVLPVFPDAQRALPGAHAADLAGLDPLRVGAGLHDDRLAADPRLLVGGAAGLHHAGDLLAAGHRRPGRAAAGVQPRARGGAGVLHRRPARRAGRRHRRTSATWAASPSARPCSPRCS